MTTAAELRRYMETGHGGPMEGNEYKIDAFVERGQSGLQRQRAKILKWLDGGSAAHNSVRDQISQIGILKTRKYVSEQLRGLGSAEEFGLATRCLADELPFCIRVHTRFPGNIQTVTMEKTAIALFQMMVAGWRDRAELHARLALGNYPTVLMDGVAFAQYPYFALDLMNDWLETNIKIDSAYRKSDLYRRTRPSGSEVYDELLEVWRDPDPKRFDRALSHAADHHIAQSRNDTEFVNEKGETDERYFEFSDISYWLFPIELLAVLRLREWVGLRNPEPPSHPLFSASMLGRLPEVVPEWPRDELIDRAEEAFSTILPELPPLPTLADLPRLRLDQSRTAGRA